MNPDESSINYEENHDDRCLKSNDILNELKRHKNGKDLKIFRKLLACPPKTFNGTWTPVLLELLNVIADNEIGHIDQMRLASQAFFTIFATWPSITKQEDYLKEILSSNSLPLYLFDKEIYVHDMESFKLTIIHGYLLASNKTLLLSDTFIMAFEIIRKYCMQYTKHIYFAFKLLDIWLKTSREIKFWNENDLEIEKKLEAIIFSNWDNCINEIATINSSHVFPVYLKIMKDKYNGFLEYAFETTNTHLSWQSPAKYIIIREICKLTHDYPNVPNLESNIFQSISKCHLKHVGTKLYITLLDKMDDKQWNASIRTHLLTWAKKWESEGNERALHILWELWMKPTLYKFKDAVVYDKKTDNDKLSFIDRRDISFISLLWNEFCSDGTMISASYIAKIASEIGVTWTKLNSYPTFTSVINKDHYDAVDRYWSTCKITRVPCIIDVSEECVKLNVFGAYCRMNDFLGENDDYELCKRFLYCNANSCSTQFRKGLLDNFKILFERVVKIRGDPEISFCQWLYYFIFDCFEPGSCYQRKIIGLRLYEIILMYTNGMVDENRKRKRKNMSDGVLLKEQMRDAQKWDIDNKYSLFILLRMCLDPIEEIREQSFRIINNYFDVNVLTNEETKTLISKATIMNKSSKFYEIAGGVKLTLIVNKYETLRDIPLHETLFDKAQISLHCIKRDIFSAFIEGSEFIASLSALLELEFQDALNNSYENFFKQLLKLIEDATIVFLSALVPQATNVSYSSSFAEMGIAIDERFKNSEVFDKVDETDIVAAHQIVLSCIWMALKTLCDLAAKLSILTNSHDNVKRSIDIVVSVLMKCRHKGAIEAAGVALGVVVRHLADKQEYQCSIDACLDKLLSLNSNDKIDLTRRGAGLSIMFHRIMSNDSKKTRRLLHVAMGRLIESLGVSAEKPHIVMDANQDCAHARQLHFLRTIVVDKTLHPHLVPYMEKISMICFEHLQSPEWAIRNASLQLMGALIPRLVGQSPESELNFGNGYSVNHFFTHYPILAQFVLQRITDPSAFNIDSNMVPIVTLISKMSVGGCDFIDYSSQKYTAHLRNAIRSLFGHTVDHVRYAAAKAYAALVSIREIPQELLNMKMEKIGNKSRNFIHGHLMAQICMYLLAEREQIWLNTFSNVRYITQMLARGSSIQADRVLVLHDYWLNEMQKNSNVPLCYIIEATFLQSCRMTSFWSDCIEPAIGDSQSEAVYFFLTRDNPSIKRSIGVSEFLDQLFKLYTREHSVCLPYMKLYDINCSAVYYSLKYVRRAIMHQWKRSCYGCCFIMILRFLTETVLNDDVIVEGLEILNLILDYESNVCPHDCSRKHSLPKLFKTIDTYASFQLLLVRYSKKRKICQLIYRVLKLLLNIKVTSIVGSISPVDVQKFITHSINNGDEEERIWVIGTLIDHDIHTIQSLIALLLDPNEGVRMALYEMMKRNEWSDDLYYFITNASDLRQCISCKHETHIIMKSLFPRNLQLFLHNVIHTLVALYPKLSPSDKSLRENVKLMPHVAARWPHKTPYEKKLESPFNEDETYCEITKIYNIYYYYVGNHNANNWPGPLQPVDYNEIIMCGNKFFKCYIADSSRECRDLVKILHFKVADYLHYKAEMYGTL